MGRKPDADRVDGQPVVVDVDAEEVLVGLVVHTLRDAPSAPVLVVISSPGGDGLEGLAIYEAFRSHAGRATVEVAGLLCPSRA